MAPRRFLPAARASSAAHFISISEAIMASAHSVWFHTTATEARLRMRWAPHTP
ncbi:MAG: hypothetical protein M1350_05215 [Actinobacteria bacterium]|nr:hypothetical protein [Actinomycetota bacterium]